MTCTLSLDLKKVTGKSDSKTLLENISFNFDKPGLIWVGGNNGAGKSVLSSIISGKAFFKNSPYDVDGEVRSRTTHGKEVIANNYLSAIEYAEYVTFLPQKIGSSLLAIHHQDDICLALEGRFPDVFGINIKEKNIKAVAKLQEILETLDMWAHLNRKYGDSSYGETRRVEFACVISPFPFSNLVVLDEPFLGLDERYQKVLAGVIQHYMARHKSIWVISSHELPSKFGFKPDMFIDLPQDENTINTYSEIKNAVLKRFRNSTLINDVDSIELHSLNIRIKQRAGPVSLIYLYAAPGEVTWIQGCNGSGKTTIVQLLAGLSLKTSFKCEIRNGYFKKGFMKAPNKTVKLALQNPYESFIHSTVRDDLERPLSPHDCCTDLDPSFFDILNKGWHNIDNIPSTFSFGQLRFLQFLLVPTDAQVIIFDEPLFGISPSLKCHIIECLASIANSGRIVISTCQVGEVNPTENCVYTLVHPG